MKLGADLEPFDRHDVCPIELAGKYQARINWLAIQENRACAAIAGTAAFLGASHADFVAQEIKQQAMSGNFAADASAVQSKLDFLVHGNLEKAWSVGVTEYWSVGCEIRKPITPSLQYSITPII
jgi:hypothetical protein